MDITTAVKPSFRGRLGWRITYQELCMYAFFGWNRKSCNGSRQLVGPHTHWAADIGNAAKKPSESISLPLEKPATAHGALCSGAVQRQRQKPRKAHPSMAVNASQPRRRRTPLRGKKNFLNLQKPFLIRDFLRGFLLLLRSAVLNGNVGWIRSGVFGCMAGWLAGAIPYVPAVATMGGAATGETL